MKLDTSQYSSNKTRLSHSRWWSVVSVWMGLQSKSMAKLINTHNLARWLRREVEAQLQIPTLSPRSKKMMRNNETASVWSGPYAKVMDYSLLYRGDLARQLKCLWLAPRASFLQLRGPLRVGQACKHTSAECWSCPLQVLTVNPGGGNVNKSPSDNTC